MSLLAYLLAGVALVGALGGLYWKVDHGGYERGKGEVQVQWDADVAARKAEAEAERERQDALRATLDKQAIRRLANEKTRSQTLMASLEAHIKAARLSPDCKLSPELFHDANRALAGPEGERTGTVPPKPGTPPPAR